MRFADIPAHIQAKKHLHAMAREGRIPHALLISGPEGTGKLALARALAQYLQCSNPQDGDSCGTCPSCRQHQSLNHADMHYIFPVVKNKSEHLLISTDYIDKWRVFLQDSTYASWQGWLDTIGAGNARPAIFVDEAAYILRVVNMSAYSSAIKIILIWLPEKLNADAANKLLKVIEEPWEDTRFILVSNDASQILPTIFSRTQRLNIPPLTTDEIASILVNEYAVDTEAATVLALRADGNACRAIEAVDTREDAKQMALIFREIMRKAYLRDVRALKELSEKCAAMGREKNCRMLEYFASMVRENFIYNLQVTGLNRMSSSEEEFSRKFSPFINVANVEDIMADLDSAAEDISRNANAKIVMFDTLLRLIVYLRRQPK